MLHGSSSWLEVVAWVEFVWIFGQDFSNCTGDRHTAVGIDIDFAYTALDASLNFFDGYTPGLLHFATKLVDDILQFLWDAAAAVHDQVGVWKQLVDGFDPGHCQNFTIGLACKLVSSMACPNSHGQRIDFGFLHEALGFVGVGQQLIVAQDSFGTMSVFGFACTGFERAQATEFAFDGHIASVRHLNDFFRDRHIVFVRCGCLAIFFERTIHHDGGEPVFDGGQASRRGIAVILVHHDRNVGIEFYRSQHQMA